MNTPLHVAAVQMVSGSALDENLAQARQAVFQAAQNGAQLVVLPEFFPFIGASERDKLAVREAFGAGPIQAALAQWAQQAGVWLVGGTVPLAAADRRRVRNACLVFGPDGALRARYDKVHLFKLMRGAEHYDESATIEAGRTPVVTDIECGGRRWRLGLAVCYDLRFPEYFRALGRVDVLVVPAAFTETTGQAHWDLLLRARALENQCYLVAAAQGGQHDQGRRTWGHSMVVDPWGQVVACHPQGPGTVHATLTQDRLKEVRTQLPALAHRVM
jgi:predicted amidohydrolase